MNRLHLQVFGLVQGVGFRYTCCREALLLGLTGWVRNLPDNSVEIVAEGAPDALQRFGNWCRHGPAHARVERVVSNEAPARGEFRTFSIRSSWEDSA